MYLWCSHSLSLYCCHNKCSVENILYKSPGTENFKITAPYYLLFLYNFFFLSGNYEHDEISFYDYIRLDDKTKIILNRPDLILWAL